MTKEGLEAINIVNSLGFNPKEFTKENAIAIQKLIAFKNEGLCSIDFVKSHIHPSNNLPSQGVKEVEGKISDLEILERFGVDARVVEGIRSYDPDVAGYESILHLFYLILDKRGEFSSWAFSDAQIEWIVRFCYFGGMDFAVKYCDPSIGVAELREVFMENKSLF